MMMQRDTVKATNLYIHLKLLMLKHLMPLLPKSRMEMQQEKFLCRHKIEDTNSDVTGKLVIYSSYGMFDDSFAVRHLWQYRYSG